MRKIAVITGTRAEYGLSRTIFEAIQDHPGLSLDVIVTGMHLMEEFGHSVDLIEKDGFGISYRTDVVQKSDTGYDMAVALGENIINIVAILKKLKPNIFLTLTDLGHTLAGAIAAAHLNIPVAHVHGGDISGSIDETLRHATTKLSHIHFPASRLSAERIRNMGEESWRIFMVGAPGVDEIRKSKLTEKEILFSRYEIGSDEDYLLIVQHPVTTEEDVREQIRETISAIKTLGKRSIIIYPNTDAGGRAIIEEYETLQSNDAFSIHKTGERAGNTIDVPHTREAIVTAVEKSLSVQFVASLKDIQSPYGEGYAGEKIASVLAEIDINQKLLNKTLDFPS